jgi:hypothetical protein
MSRGISGAASLRAGKEGSTMIVKALVDCFVDGGYRKKGEEFDYRGPKNDNLQTAKRAKADAEEQAADAEEKAAEV